MDAVEQTAAEQGPAEQSVVPVEQTEAAVTEAPAQEQTPAQEQMPEPVPQVCKNCGYHDPSGGPAERCPACYFRHNSSPVHQVQAKAEAKKPDAEKQPEVEAETEAKPTEAEQNAEALAESQADPEETLEVKAGATVVLKVEAPAEQPKVEAQEKEGAEAH